MIVSLGQLGEGWPNAVFIAEAQAGMFSQVSWNIAAPERYLQTRNLTLATSTAMYQNGSATRDAAP